METRNFNQFVGFSIVLSVLTLFVLLILRWLNISSGYFLDWVIGLASFWWLVWITVVPWNIHFKAREVLSDVALSKQKKLHVSVDNEAYVMVWTKRSLWIALGLHGGSAIILYTLAILEISPIGYIGSAAALLLTGLRPTMRGRTYLIMRLAAIQRQVKYPRDDIRRVEGDITTLKKQVELLEANFDLTNEQSWATQQQGKFAVIEKHISQLNTNLNNFQATNQTQHKQLAQEAQQAVARITIDEEHLNHIREVSRILNYLQTIIRFVKEA